MYCMILKASGMRTLSALLLHVDHKNPIVRGKVATFLLALLSHKGKDLLGTKELDLLKSKLGKILQDQSPVARSSGRSVVRVLIENNYATTADLENYISIDLIQKALKDPHSQSGFNLSELKATTSFHDKAGSPMRAMPLQSLSPRKSRGKVYEGFSGVASKERDPSPSPFKRSIVRNISTESAIKDQRDSPFRPSNKLAKERDMQLESFSMASEVDSHNIGLSLSPSASMAELAALSSTPVHKVPKSPRGNRKEVKISNSQSAAKRAMETNSELLNLQQLLQSTTVSSWSERKSAIEELKELLLKHKVVLLDSGKMSSCIDHILNRVEDGNVKVRTINLSASSNNSSQERLWRYCQLL